MGAMSHGVPPGFPRVSIVIPVYNGVNYARHAIDSALAQDYANTEVIVVNDGSRDDGATDALARSYGERIRYVNKPNGGVASALNAGISAMTGDVFCWLSHDDTHLPHKTSRQVELWRAAGCPEEVLFSDYRLINAEGEMITEVRLDHAMLEAKPLYALLRGSIHGCSVFVPRQMFDAVGLFNEALPTTQDYDLWHRMIRRYRFRHIPEVLIESRWHDEQGSKKIDHVAEATAMWTRIIEELSHEQMREMEGSPLLFLTRMSEFMKANGLTAAAERFLSMAEEALAKTLVSIVIPAFNAPDMTLSAVRSAIQQTHPTTEVIVVDDGSTEDMSQVREALAPLGASGRYIRQENAGPAAARNAGWAEAKGSFVAFLDADDLFVPDKIARQLRFMEAEGLFMSHTSYMRFDMPSGEFTRIGSGWGNRFPGIIGGCGIATPTVMLRRSLRDEGLIFPETLRIGEDVVLWIRIGARRAMAGLDEALTIVRTSATSNAYDQRKQLIGVANILAAVRADPELAVHTSQINELEALLLKLSNSESLDA
jgi:glycosyltransferase involved in cell wall biosynthesis